MSVSVFKKQVQYILNVCVCVLPPWVSLLYGFNSDSMARGCIGLDSEGVCCIRCIAQWKVKMEHWFLGKNNLNFNEDRNFTL